MNIYTAIDEAVGADPDAQAQQVAEKLFRRALKGDLFPLLLEEVEHKQRILRRAGEEQYLGTLLNIYRQAASSGRATPDGYVAFSVEVPVHLMAILHQSFKLGDGTETTWLDASVEQHEQRLQMLYSMRRGLDRTIERHEEAVAVLKKTGAKSLRELTSEEGAA